MNLRVGAHFLGAQGPTQPHPAAFAWSLVAASHGPTRYERNNKGQLEPLPTILIAYEIDIHGYS